LSTSALEVVTDTEAVGSLVKADSGVMALAMMGEKDFQLRLEVMKKGQERMRLIQKELLIGPTAESPEGEDYGVIPGTKKPTLLKPGAEKICLAYGLVPSFEDTWIEGDGATTPHLRVRMKCLLHRGSKEGPVVGEGVGAANSWERKHRYRGALKSCPSCGCEGTIKRSGFEKDGDKGWYCHAKVGGCGANFRSTDPAITEQQAGQVQNPDPFDVENTLLKMAKKRAQVDATLTATGTSGLFTQDMEDAPSQAERKTATPAERQPGEDDVVETSGGPVVVGSGERAAKAGAKPNPAHKSAAIPACPVCGSAKAVVSLAVGEFICSVKAHGCGQEWRA
jgi:hypothetical protein